VTVELQINNSVSASARFVSWAPSPCRIRVTNPTGATGPSIRVRLAGVSAAGGGAIVLRKGATGAFSASLTLQVPINGSSVGFFVAGKFGKPSVNNGDVSLVAKAGAAVVGSVPLMVRIRKNAVALTPAERERFIAALAQLNNQGIGRFQDFRDMHRTDESLDQAHGMPAFLPWHRAYLLDLERELQAIDPSVALPYWRFDQPAPTLFAANFLGASDNLGTVSFAANNPLQFWTTDGIPGITRRPLFPITQAPPTVRSEAATLALGATYAAFRTMEGNPHGRAHTSWGGMIQDAHTAPRDPLFFLLHCNVDRLWAKWQRQNHRFDPALASSFENVSTNPVGHRLNDSMWPWNGVTTPPRPPFAPGGMLAPSPSAGAPGPQPLVRGCIDFQGSVAAASRMGFDYDDTAFA
jgi:tyrosinase